ncbi:MAG: leucine-rich repeat domain-containing protein [Marinilabiliaceae bacterium]|nr:leucine-rich repeat domain-containing protein [Marinilabiliaceae bacterium]
MNLKLKYHSILLFVLTSFIAVSQNSNSSKAKQYATDFFNARKANTVFQKAPSSSKDGETIIQSYESPTTVNTPLYVFENSAGGFVMLAHSNNTYNVVGYSNVDSFDATNIPPQLSSLMTYYEDSLKFFNPAPAAFTAGTPVVEPLLYEHGIKLNQYQHSEVGGSWTGCMATAITQIMLFHAAEKGTLIKGYGSHCYTYGSYGDICADFENAVYNNDELLSYHVAISMDMRFTTAGSSPPSADKVQSIEEYFHFFIKNTTKEDFYIINELEHRRPVYASLYGVPESHAVVIDGYDDKSYYHLNFGWGGSYNGFYLMNNNSWIGTGSGEQRFNTNIQYINIISPSQMPVNVQDSLALVAVHNALGGYEATHWDLTKPVWTWPGVLVMNDRVIRLSIDSEAAPASSQSIAPEIGNLTALQELHINGCLNGTIPDAITNLTNLKKLHISNNVVYINPTLHKGSLQDVIPADISSLTNLEWLSFSNVLEGTIPASIGQLSNLELLYIYNDTANFGKGSLTGIIPSEIGNLSKIKTLTIANQQLEGVIPSQINSLTELTSLNLSGNSLNGAIPQLIMPKLGYLVLNDNELTSITDEAWSCPMLTNIELQNNAITSAVPSFFGNISLLSYLNLANNQIPSLSEEVGNLINLEGIVLDNNQLTSLPDGLALNMNLKNLSAKNNQIEYIPSNLGQSKSLTVIDLSHNKIAAIPDELGNNPGLTQIYLNNNQITNIPASFANVSDNASVFLDNNEMQGAIPEKLMLSDKGKFVRLNNNRFVFDDIPQSANLKFGVRDQKTVILKKQVFNVQLGDTVQIDIRDISRLKHSGNEYYWFTYPEFQTMMTKDERLDGINSNPVLSFVVNEQNVKNTYYCKVFNPDSPTFTFEYDNSSGAYPCIYYLNTDTISFKLATDEEILAERFAESFVTSLASTPGKTVSDKTVTLVPPLKVKRGEVYWEASSDGINWVRVSDQMDRADLKANVKSSTSNELVLSPRNHAFYRCCINEDGCDPLYSDKLLVKSLGTLLFDEVINVTENMRTISVDSIEVVVPLNFHNSDFRLTITKMENEPASPAGVMAGNGYDVTVSFADTFDIPLLIKLKNVDKTKIDETEIDRFQAVYYDDINREWKPFEKSGLSLKDSTINIFTNHLTKMKWWWYAEEYRMGFTDVYERNNIVVFYKYEDLDYINLYRLEQSEQSWHVPEISLMVQDITEYLPVVMAEYKRLGLSVPDGKFKVYVQYLKGEDGCVGIIGMLNGYLSVGRSVGSPQELAQVLAHEYMHYTQDYYISANGGNQFWMEAHATLSDRIVWDDKTIPVCESEEYLKDGLRGKINYTFNSLANSWDAWDLTMASNAAYSFFKTEETLQYYYTAGTFLHYMRSCRPDPEKLSPAILLSETSWFGSWRTYLAGYVSNHLNSILGDEYEDFVKYLLSGENEKFTVINKSGNPYAYIQDPKNTNVFNYPLTYRFAQGDNMVQTDNVDIEVPYMAAKIVLLENINPDTMVLVNYKRKHDFDYDHMVYHCTYDFEKQKMNFVDISDSTEYVFLLDSRDKDNITKKFNNYSFLLLINKEYIGASSLIKDFNASFELTAMPLLDVESVGLLSIYSGNSPLNHTFSDGFKDLLLGSPNASFLQSATDFTVYETEKTTTKQLVNRQTYRIQTQYALIINQGPVLGAPTMKDSTIYTQTIEHDVIAGTFKISEHELKYHRLNTYVELVPNTDGDYEAHLVYSAYTDMVSEKVKTYWLNDFMPFLQPQSENEAYNSVYGKNIMYFLTNSTSETQNLITKMDGSFVTSNYDKSGSMISETSSQYESTDYSNPDLKVYLVLRMNME